MKILLVFFIISIFLSSCNSKEYSGKQLNLLVGSWRLISGTVEENGEKVITDYTSKVSFIKIINNTHFAFLQHDIKVPKDSSGVFVGGGGTYTLTDSNYTEHLEYCSARVWEGKYFKFIISIKNDTLTQQGREKVDGTTINRFNTEVYCRIRN